MGRGLIPWLVLVALGSPALGVRQGVAGLEAARVLGEARRGGASGEVPYHDPGPVRRRLERALFASLLGLARADAPVPALAALGIPAAWLGFELRVLASGGERVIALVERPPWRRGAGAYLLRVGPSRWEAFVQAPHPFSDLGSADLALELFRSSGARALGSATVHRRGRSGLLAENGGDTLAGAVGADVSRNGNSSFHAMTLAWLGTTAGAPIVQVHGFRDERAAADVVLSSGEKLEAPSWLRDLKHALLGAAPGARVALFPDDVQDLGAVTNVQGKAARGGGARFLHIELSASFRRTLAHDPDRRRDFLRSLAVALGAKPESP